MRENQPNCPKAFLSVGSFKEKRGSNSRTPEPIFLKFCDIVCECKCQLLCGQLIFHVPKSQLNHLVKMKEIS